MVEGVLVGVFLFFEGGAGVVEVVVGGAVALAGERSVSGAVHSFDCELELVGVSS